MIEGKEVRVDWLRFSGPRSRLEAIVDLLCQYFGEWQYGRGAMFLARSMRWGVAALYFDEGLEAADHCVIDLPGSALALLDRDEVITLAGELAALSCRPTRVDVAVDFEGDQIQLVQTVDAACRGGELCGARRFEYRERFGSGQRRSLHMVTIGARGNLGSGRYVRVYDKGLETGTADEGRWVRWECEFSDDCAREVVSALVASSDWRTEAMERALGAVDFREANGSVALARRPRSAWWRAVIEGLSVVRTTAKRLKSTLIGYTRWLGRSVWPSLTAFAENLGCSVEQLVSELVGPVKPRYQVLLEQVGRELVHEVRFNRESCHGVVCVS